MSRGIGTMVCSDGIFECASFENVFFVYIQQNNDPLLLGLNVDAKKIQDNAPLTKVVDDSW
jgi:hypothetical protein